jgi:CRP-like cAMP-binding protein
MRHVYFPTAGVVALLAQVNDHPPVAVGMVGAEGLVGLSMVCGERAAAVGAIVQVAGTALRLSAQARRPECPLWGALQVLVGRYTGALVLQLAQQAACSQFHGLEARLGRWLLMTHDRAPAEAWQLTQHFLATLLGVRRESVTQAAHRLQARQLIDYRRGQLRLLDRPGLARVACPCYVQLQADDGLTSPRRR